jgi:hypothetical protein
VFRIQVSIPRGLLPVSSRAGPLATVANVGALACLPAAISAARDGTMRVATRENPGGEVNP